MGANSSPPVADDQNGGVWGSSRVKDPVPGPGPGPGGKTPEPDKPAAAEKKETPEDAAPTGPLSTADAHYNFRTVIVNYLALNGEDGVWTASDPKTLLDRKLKLKSIDQELHEVGSGLFVYVGRVFMSEEGKSRPTAVYFTVHLAGSDWQVLKYEFTKPAAAAGPGF
jgi:hypothetical protein